MFDDPIVEQVRKVRDELAKQGRYDIDEVFSQAIIRQEKAKRETVSFAIRKKKLYNKIAERKV